MAKPTIDVAALAKEYGSRPVQCRACKMNPEILDVARQLKVVHGLAFKAISRALAGKFNERVSDESLRRHFAEHEGRAA